MQNRYSFVSSSISEQILQQRSRLRVTLGSHERDNRYKREDSPMKTSTIGIQTRKYSSIVVSSPLWAPYIRCTERGLTVRHVQLDGVMSSSASPAQPPCYHPPPPTISDSHKYHEGGILAITKNYAVENSSHSGLRECPRDHQCDSKRSLTVKVPLGDEVRLKAARILIKSSIKSSHPYRKFADGRQILHCGGWEQ